MSARIFVMGLAVGGRRRLGRCQRAQDVAQMCWLGARRLISGGGGSDGAPLRHRVKTMEASGESGATRTGWNEKIAQDGQSQDEAVQPARAMIESLASLAPVRKGT